MQNKVENVSLTIMLEKANKYTCVSFYVNLEYLVLFSLDNNFLLLCFYDM